MHPSDQYAITASTWNTVAQLYEEKFASLPYYTESYDRFIANISSDKAHILDAGCGPGIIARYLSGIKPAWKFTGVDVAPTMLEIAAAVMPDAQWLVSDVREINKLSDRFNGVVAGFVLPYLTAEDAHAWIKALPDILLPGGIIYISFVDGNPARSGMITNSKGDRVYFAYYEETQVQSWLLEAGFTLLQPMYVSYETGPDTKDTHVILMARYGAVQ